MTRQLPAQATKFELSIATMPPVRVRLLSRLVRGASGGRGWRLSGTDPISTRPPQWTPRLIRRCSALHHRTRAAVACPSWCNGASVYAFHGPVLITESAVPALWTAPKCGRMLNMSKACRDIEGDAAMTWTVASKRAASAAERSLSGVDDCSRSRSWLCSSARPRWVPSRPRS